MRDTNRGDDRGFGADELLPVVARTRAARYPRTVPFEAHRDGAWQAVTLVDHVRSTEALAAGLIAEGVRPGDRVALMASTRYEWILLDMAIWTAGAVTVPIHPSSSAAQVEWILADSGAVLLVAEGAEHESVLAAVELPATCREVFYLDHGDLYVLPDSGLDVSAATVESALETLTPDSPCSIVYTSGTTGRPRGCVLTHANLLAECHGLLDHPVGDVCRPGFKTLMFLPLAHVAARAVTYVMFLGGGTTGFWADTSDLTRRFAEYRPHMVLGVPRVFEKVRDDIAARAGAGGRARAAVFHRAEQAAIDHSRRLGGSGLGDTVEPSLRRSAEYALYDRLVYASVREALGGRCRYAISGGGALPERTAHFFRGLGVPVFEGYGFIETSAAITCNGPGCQRIGTVGRPIGSNEVAIGDDGEVLVRGPVVFPGYLGRESDPGSDDAALPDGWFATGDLGELDDDGYLRITGRKVRRHVVGERHAAENEATYPR